MSVPVYIQMQNSENGATAFSMILGYYKKFLNIQEIREHCTTSRNGASPDDIIKCADYYDIDAKLENIKLNDIRNNKELFPFIAKKGPSRYVVVRKIINNHVYLNDPSKGLIRQTIDDFNIDFSGDVIFFHPRANFQKESSRKNPRQIISERIWPYKSSIFKIAGISALIVLVNLIYLSITKNIVDQFKATSFEMSNVIAFSLYAILAIYSILLFLKVYNTQKTCWNMASKSASKVVNKLLNLPMSFFEKHFAGEILNRISNDLTFNISLLRQVVPNIIEVIMLICYLVIMVQYNVKLTVIVVIVEFIFLLILLILQIKISNKFRSVATTTGNIDSYVFQGLNMIDDIKASASEKVFFKIWSSFLREKQYASVSSQDLLSTQKFIKAVFSVFTSAIILFMGAYLIIKGEFSVGMLFVIQSIFTNIDNNIKNVMDISNVLYQMSTNVERIDDILANKSCPKIELNNDKTYHKLSGNIKVENLSYKYADGEDYAIKDISFNLKKGDIIAVVGRSGSGKSTLINCISSLYDPWSGKITYDGKTKNQIPDVVFTSSLSVVSQWFTVFNDTINNNLTMWDQTIEDKTVAESCKKAKIYDRILLEQNGFNSQITKNGANFSSGELQRLELAKALCKKPTILILDEFTSSLDANTEQYIFNMLRELGCTCLIAAHRFSTVVKCDNILVMDNGQIIENGTHEYLMQNGKHYREMIQM